MANYKRKHKRGHSTCMCKAHKAFGNSKERWAGGVQMMREHHDKENLNKPKKRKKACKFTKAEHGFAVKKFNVEFHRHGRYNKKLEKHIEWPCVIFHIEINYRCGCGKKKDDYFGKYSFFCPFRNFDFPLFS